MKRRYDDIDESLQGWARRSLWIAHIVAGVAASAAAAYTAFGPLAEETLIVRFNIGLIFGLIAFSTVHLVHLIVFLIQVEFLVRRYDREIASYWSDLTSDLSDPRD